MAPKGRILVVDDDQAICTVVGEALRRSGHKVKAAGTIAERRQLLRSFAPDILITDVKLPDGDGLDDVAHIISEYPDINVIILSAQNTLNTAIRATEKRSEEHTSELQSLMRISYAVFCLKKKKTKHTTAKTVPSHNHTNNSKQHKRTT